MMNVSKMSKVGMIGMSWLAAALTLSLAAGCMEEPSTSSETPSVVDVETTVTVPASARTTESLGISSWRYQRANDGVLVTGVAADAQDSLASFLVTPGATAEEMTAREGNGKDAVSIVLAGGLRGGSEALRADVAAFRADVEAHEKLTMKRDRNVGENVFLCPGQQGTFTTWFFGNTSIGITAGSTTSSISFQAAAGATEYGTVPAYATYVYARIFGGFNVNVKSRSGSCVRVQVW